MFAILCHEHLESSCHIHGVQEEMDDLQEVNKELADGIMEDKAGADDEAEEVPWLLISLANRLVTNGYKRETEAYHFNPFYVCIVLIFCSYSPSIWMQLV